MTADKKEKLKQSLLKASPFIIGAIIIAVIIYSVITIADRSGKVKVKVIIAPYAAKVKIGDKEVRNNADNYIIPGEYKLSAEFENFKSLEFDVKIEEGMDTIARKMLAANSAGEEYTNQHIKEFLAIEGIAAQKAEKEGKARYEKWPILEKLPIRDAHYTIGYTITDDNKLTITIDSTLEWRSMAVGRVLTMLEADDLEKYDAIVTNIESPFTSDFHQNNANDLESFLRDGYGSAMDGFVLHGSECTNDYCYGYMGKKMKYAYDNYRFVVRRNTGQTFSFISAPYPVLTTENTPGVPKAILYAANTIDLQ